MVGCVHNKYKEFIWKTKHISAHPVARLPVMVVHAVGKKWHVIVIAVLARMLKIVAAIVKLCVGAIFHRPLHND